LNRTNAVAVALILGLSVTAGAEASAGKTGGSSHRPEGGLFDQIFGVRISNVVADPNTFDVTFDVTEFASSTYPYTTIYLGPFTPFYGYVLAPAVDFGDGSTVPPLTYPNGMPSVGTSTLDTANGGTGVFRVFRGSFSHTYAGPGTYEVRANSACCAADPANTVVDGGVLTTIYTYNFPPYTFTYRFFYDVAEIEFGGPSVLEIPTMSTVGLMALGLALLGAGFVALRRVRI
jgi:hypothetical protein